MNRNTLYLFFDLTQIAGIFYVLYQTQLSLLLFISIPLIAAKQHALFSCMHEASHGHLIANKRLDRIFGNVICVLLFIPSFSLWTSHHLLHHRYLGTRFDPYWAKNLKDPKWQFPMKASQLFRIVVGDVIGINADSFQEIDWPVPIKTMTKMIPIFCWGMMLVITANSWTLPERPFFLYMLLAWVLARFSFFVFFFRMRLIAEHYGCPAGSPPVRNIRSGPLESFFLTPHNLQFHAAHHEHPEVPSYMLFEKAGSKFGTTFWGSGGVLGCILKKG